MTEPSILRLGAAKLAGCPGFRQILLVLPDEQAGHEQLAVLRRMTPEERWRASRQLYWSARRLKAAFLRHQHAEWSDEQIEQEIRRVFLHARS